MPLKALVAAAVAAAVLATAGPATATVPEPRGWPVGTNLETTSSAVRFSGADRYATSAAMTSALHGRGGYPFTTPDPAADWWGAATCPSGVLLVAGDSPADALAAASLSDPTDGSNEPRLIRAASADVDFDPPGELDRVDLAGAPIVVTRGVRAGGVTLEPATRAALSDLVTGRCRDAHAAVIVGGAGAVAPAVELELLTLGFTEVFRVAGPDRYGTAAAIARSLGTEPAPTSTCDDPDVADGSAEMGFYGNAVFEFRTSPTACRVLGGAVVLAEGGTGADALAAGWWTSWWQVPVLLTSPDGTLPAATREALVDMAVDTVIVLGGTARIPEAVAQEAAQLATATLGRIAGPDRWSTSLRLAEAFGGWFPTGDPADSTGSVVCVAASSGADHAAGWPDALGAGPWCATAAAGSSAPIRALPPVSGPDASALPEQARARRAIPVLLVPAGAAALPASVREFLGATFPATANWCSGRESEPGCRLPGFTVVAGGTGVVPNEALRELTTLIGVTTDREDLSPRLDPPFLTGLDLDPVFNVEGEGSRRVCVPRVGVGSARWFVAETGDGTQLAAADLVALLAYRQDNDGTARTPGRSAPSCLAVPDGQSLAGARAVSLSGHTTAQRAVPGELAVFLDGPLTSLGTASASGPALTTNEPGTVSTLTWDDQPATAVALTRNGVRVGVRRFALEVVLSRGRPPEPAHFVISFAIATPGENIYGSAAGEALFVDGRWELAGSSSADGRTGGYRATIDPRGTPDGADDRIDWRIDAG